MRRSTVLEAEYEIGQQLGEGGQGVVRLCTHKSTGVRYACKSVSKSSVYDHQHVRREITSLARLKQAGSHPNVIHVQQTLEDSDFVHIIMELCEGGDLFSHITKCTASGHLSETHAANAFSAIVHAVCFCHCHRVMHRDIKLENVLLARPLSISNDPSTPGNSTPHDVHAPHDYSSLIRLADFGASANISRGFFLDDMHGTLPYLSPEFLATRMHDERVDVWSLGVLLYTLLCGYYPFNGDTATETLEAIKQGRITDLFMNEPWPSVSSLAKDLIVCMLERDPTRRIQLNRILAHPWLLGCPASAKAMTMAQPPAPLQSSCARLHADLPCNQLHIVEAK